MVHPSHVSDGVALFAETELLPALSGWRLVVASAALIRLKSQSGELIPAITGHKAAAALGLVSSDGMIDVDGAAAALKESIRKHGKLTVDIPMMGEFKFSEENVDTLVECIRKAAGASQQGVK